MLVEEVNIHCFRGIRRLTKPLQHKRKATIILLAMEDDPPIIEAEIAKPIKTIYGANIKPEKNIIHK